MTAQEAAGRGRQMELNSRNKGRFVLFVVLPMIVLFSLSLWYLRNFYRKEFAQMTRIQASDGVYDLTGIDFTTGFAYLQGDVTYIPGILTPEEFKARENEAVTGSPWQIPAATSRIRIRVPGNGPYIVTASSIDFAHRVYVNGVLRFEAGTPAETAEEFVPGCAWMALEVMPENGVIELIQQGANFVHREGGGHSNFFLGAPSVMQRFQSLTFGPEYIIVGLFAALFLVHLVLYLVRRSYRPNLIFSILCFTWMIRSGVTGAKVFFAMFPSLPWQAAFRAEYLSLPVASIFVVLLAREMFPGVLKRWFVRTVMVVSGAFSLFCLTAHTLWMSWSLVGFEAFFTLSILYLCVVFVRKVPGLIRGGRFEIEQTISLTGYCIFMFAAINDAMHHLGIPRYLGVKTSYTMTGLAMLIFSFFQMAAMFYGTMREVAQAQERERRAEAENEMLSEMNRLKSNFYTDMSHEMKTPLTVIAVNAQFVAQNIDAGIADDETVTDLNAISTEARRLAQMVTSFVTIGRMQGTGGGQLSLTSLLTETARIYQSLFARKDNTLVVEAAPDLPLVEGNADQLIQVLINLLSNANRHTSGGVVTIHAEALESKVQVSITDNGEGIAPDLLAHVFERFYHGEKGGSGLGIPICKTIIEEHGGEIGIESEEGRGTTVWFTLPVKEETDDE